MSIETFNQYPLHMDPQSKAISCPGQSASVASELESLNTLHRALLTLDDPTIPHKNIPPPPLPVHPKRSAQVAKMRETANASFKRGNYADSVRLYGLAIDMALGRPAWEPASLVRDEVALLYSNRAQAYMAQQLWAEAWVDVQTSVELSPMDNSKAWWRGGKCLTEMMRWEEAMVWVRKGLETENGGESSKDLISLLGDIEEGLKRSNS